MKLMKSFSRKIMQQLAILAILTFTLTSHAMKKVVPCGDELNNEIQIEILATEIPIEILAAVGTFLEERELFILARWHKTPEDRKYILEYSSREKKIRFDQKLETYQQHKKKLRLKKDRLYTKLALRTCSCGTQLLVKIPLWFTLAVTNFALEITRGACALSVGFIVGICACFASGIDGCVRECNNTSDSCLKCLRIDLPGYHRNECFPDYLVDECWSVSLPCESFIEDRREIEYLESQIIERN